MRSLLYVTLGLRILLVLVGLHIAWRLTWRAARNGPVVAALADYFVANSFALMWYLCATIEFRVWGSTLFGTFGIVVWIPLAVTTGRLWYTLFLLRGKKLW